MRSQRAARRLSRRTVLRGAGGVAIALPFLEAMAPRSARGATKPPKRFVVFAETNGNTPSNWIPTGGETDFQLSPILKPVEAFRQHLLILARMNNETARNSIGAGHMKAFGSMLTGQVLLKGNFMAGGTSAGYPNGVSVDQTIARAIGETTKFRSLEFGVQVNAQGNNESRMIYQGPNQPVPPESNPQAAFKRIFSDLPATGGGTAVDPSLKVARRKTVLDHVLGEYRKLNARLGAGDRQKLDAHLDAIRQIESRLGVGAGAAGPACVGPTGAGATGQACTEPEQAAGKVNCTDALYGATGKAQMDLLVKALACDLTRVASLQWSNCGNRLIFRTLGHTETHHDLAHAGDTARLTRINVWYAEQFAYLLGKMKEIKEADGSTLLDNTVVLWCNELSVGAAHSTKSMPYVLAGGGGGALRTGRFLSFPDVSHNNLLVSCMNAMGVEATTYGDTRFCTGPLPGLK